MEGQVLTCKICSVNLISIDDFFHHNDINHIDSIHITCPVGECLRFYSNRKSIRNHISSHLKLQNYPKNFANSVNQVVSHSSSLDQAGPKTNSDTASQSEILSELKMNLLKQILHLLADENISRKNSFDVLKSSFHNYSTVFKKLVESGCLLQSEEICFEDFEEFFYETPNVLKSEYRLRKTLIDAGYLVQSVDAIIHSEKILVYVNGLPKMIDDDRIVKVFNTSKMLNKFFDLPNVTRDVVNYVHSLNKSSDGPISNFVQSKLWKWHLSLCADPNSILQLPIFLYFDDFEPLNALGSHSGAYKIGASYMGLPFLPDDIVSKLKYILPLALFFSEDRKTFGNEIIFAPIIKQLNFLYSDGITVDHSNLERIKFKTVLILGDNLGLNGILGFVESFVANFYCRFCRNIKHVMHKQVKEDVAALRNELNYSQDVATKNPSATGIKEECVFHSMCDFHVTKNYSVDLLHDFLEGDLHFDLCNIISSLIKKGCFTLDELNSLIKTHNYGPCVKNKSIDDITIEMLAKEKIRCSGAEMETLFTNFATIIGHKVPHDADEWKVYIKMREIYSVLTAKVALPGAHQLLHNLIIEHHELFLMTFPEKHFKTKHHLMVHYPSIMHMIGLICRISSLRYEAYHKKFKNVSKVTACRINLLTTFARKIEYQFADLLLNFTTIECQPNFGPKEYIDYNVMACKYGFSMEFKSFFITSWVEKGGITVKRNCVIQTATDRDDSPIFGLVKEIIIIDGSKILFCCQALENLGFDRHFYAFAVIKCTEYYICQFKYELLDKVSYINETMYLKHVTF